MLKFLGQIIPLIPISVSAQVTVVNRSLVDSSLGIAYLGVENAIEITGLKNNKEDILFSTTNGTITRVDQNRYLLMPSKTGECIVSFQTKKQKLAAKTFRVDTLVEGRVRLGGVRDSFATIQEIVLNPFLVVETPGSFYKYGCQIAAFIISMDGASFEDMPPQEMVNGYIIPETVLTRIKRLRKGDHILFEQLRCICGDGRARILKPFHIIIK